MSSKLLIATLSFEARVLRDVVFTIPLRAATISGPFIKAGIPTLSDLVLGTGFCLRGRTTPDDLRSSRSC